MSTHKTKLICFRLTPKEKTDITNLTKLQGISPSDVFRNYTMALLAGEALLYPPRGEEVAYK